MSDEIILVKLVNNDQYIGVLKEEDENGIRIENPLKIEVMYNFKTSKTPIVALLPWNELSAMDDIYFDKLHVLYYTYPKDAIITFYNSQISEANKQLKETDDGLPSDPDVLREMIELMTSDNTIN